MNEKRFIQLINLQIDGEISPPELEALENEVAANPRRREIYHSYTRLQQASEMVCNRLGPALAESVDLKKYQILTRESHGLQRGLLYSAGAMVAACLSVVAAVAVFQEGGSAKPLTNPAAQVVAVEVFEPGVLNKSGNSLRLVGINPAPEPFSFLGSFSSQNPRFEPSSAASNWENGYRPVSTSSSRVIRGRTSFEAPELVSFEFQR